MIYFSYRTSALPDWQRAQSHNRFRRFRNLFPEDSSVEIRDDVTSIFLNASAAAKAKPELREFLAYVGGQAADADDSDLVIALRTAVRSAIDDDEGEFE